MRQDLVGARQAKARRGRIAACTLSLATCLAPASAYAYRTGEDSEALAGRGRVAWSNASVSFSMSEQGLPANVTKSEIENALSVAMAAWSSPDCSHIQLVFDGWTEGQPEPRDEKNTIAWVNDWSERGFPTLTPGNTVMQYRGHDDRWDIAEADIFLNAPDYGWTAADPASRKQTSIEAVLTHEIGHALGLLHPCEVDGADGAPDCAKEGEDVRATTMYPLYDSDQSSLSDDDVAGICYLYPPAEDCAEPCLKGQTCVDKECRNTCGEQVCASGEECGFWGCVPQGACTERDCIGFACESDDVCGPLATCTGGVCVAGKIAWGDRCTTSSSCANGACVDGTCQPTCELITECGPLGRCQPSEDGRVHGCVSSEAYPVGAHCASGEDCRSKICVFTDQGGVCTDECSEDSSCSSRWTCRSVDERHVCVPPSISASGGCDVAVAPLPSSQGQSSFAWLCVAALIAARKTRKGTER